MQTNKLTLLMISILIGICGTGVALYVGGYILFVKGIILIVHSFCAHPVNGSGIAWGIVRIICASAVSGFILVISLLPAIYYYYRKEN